MAYLKCIIFLFLFLVNIACFSESSPRRLQVLVPAPALLLPYHRGPLLTGPRPVPVNLIWYGSFSPSQKAVVTDFLASFASTAGSPQSVSSWWKTASEYTDQSKTAVSGSLLLGAQSEDAAAASFGKNLKKSDIASLVLRTVSSNKAFAANPRAIYLVLTGEDVLVESFCMSSCGFHDHTPKGGLLYAWVGNPAKQCPGMCAWPFAVPQYGPPSPPLRSPNGDVGMDGMVINIATLLAGTATNPLGSGYYQGDPRVPNEAVSACTGIFGQDAYPGYPGKLLEDQKTGVSFNSHGINSRFFLLPAMWSPSSKTCVTLT